MNETILLLNDKIDLVVRHKATDKSDTFSVRRSDTGKNLEPLTAVGFGKFADLGTLRVKGSDHVESFTVKPCKVRVPIGIDENTGKVKNEMVPTGEHYLSVTLYNVDIGGRSATLTLTLRPDDKGRYLWSLSGSFPTGGSRGAAAATPTDGDDLF